MPITLITGPANAGKAELVLDAVRRELAHGGEPLLVVPTRADAEHYLRELAGEGAAIGVRVERFAGLLAEVVARAGILEPVLGTLARERLLEALVVRSSPDREAPLRAGAGGRGFVRALGELLAELQVRRISPGGLDRALERWRAADGLGRERVELGSIFASYRAELDRLGRIDVEQRAVRALDALRERPSLWGGSPVAFYGFDDLTALQLDAIETLGAVVDAPVTVSLAYEPGRAAFAGRAASFHAIAPLAAEHRSLPARAEHYAPAARAPLSHLERSLFEPGAARVGHGSAVRLLEGGGERAELELVSREIVALIGEGVRAEEIAVLARPAGVSLELLAEVFAASRIPLAMHRRRAFADTATGGALVGLLRCVPAPQRRDGGAAPGALADLLAYLRAPGLLDQPALADRLELSARRGGALDSERARALWEARHWRLEAIERMLAAQERGARALLDRTARELQRLFAAPRRGQARVLDGEELDEAGAVSVARRALMELRELARFAPELVPASAGELARVLSGLRLLGGEGPAPGMVAVLDPLELRARRVRALFVCGLQEGVFPSRARPQPLLGEEDRRRLAELSGLRLGEREDLLAAERYLLYATLSRPQERLVLSWHAADDDGQPTPRSLFVDDVCDLFDRALLDDRARRALGASDVAELDWARAGAAPGAGGAEPGAPVVANGSPPARPDEPLREELLLAELRERPWSASALERFIACPVSWFVERVLRPGELEPDAEPLVRGALAHAALKDTFEALRRETGSARLTLARLALARELLADALARVERERPLSVAPERRSAARRRLHADLDRFLAQAAASGSGLEPAELELGFGFAEGDERGEASELGAFELGDGVRMRGRIDRVDVGAGGEAIVYDYKGKDPPPAARWIRDGKLQVALYMLAVEQLLGLQAVGGFYQPLAGAELRPRGALDGEAGIELDCVSTDALEHEELRELLAQARASALEVAARAASGQLRARPQTCAFRGGCMYPTICRCER
ncbi:MAG TPA: PD-(D/E)XK nuclease family protein [Solirubrobacteraceae bacterium]|jgi:ATP-dependent helicase/DNAse subunit B|nr:PD-(D/E)XK nuclease family protein [Solirubrobacteraceae bacterium]